MLRSQIVTIEKVREEKYKVCLMPSLNKVLPCFPVFKQSSNQCKYCYHPALSHQAICIDYKELEDNEKSYESEIFKHWICF